ncbi:tRNA uridine-5-carboxymethylaminomethyl(34) synthesis GTPase MnmE [Chromatocurvus halotolerans]|uniref:tRNA modification GTPase MnmE n=1 Tax=Chromatocurvus halotolerans TaxID=1132028 RepID=A0A4R2KHG9_9GAMM|nr:tRNA uridine-5-carboxymethylaminomethyl(34) synthesis GTPase MnmE [Chromatocurvus halotolerans]TCO72594.1 tRNA modification GTPase trmE [Chromatocurvus halotolerans]
MTLTGLPDDTIVAIATAPGRGGVGIVRLSGPQSDTITARLTQGTALKPRHATRVTVHDANGELLDDGLALRFPGPHSFTGEDVVELHCHGGPILLDLVVQAACHAGARTALPGEFSRRAFLNDKIDLTQAEAIADLINSTTAAAARNASRSLTGVFSARIDALVEAVIGLRVYVEAAMDFPEEEVDFLAEGDVGARLEDLLTQLDAVMTAARQGSRIREGMKLVIAGAPNAGKSSLLNALAGRDTAIVTDVAGTTRDLLHENIDIDGLPLHIVDTAGLRDSADAVEKEGIRRALAEIQEADRVLLVVDDSHLPDTVDQAMLWPPGIVPLPDGTGLTLIRNKCDLSGRPSGIVATETGAEITLCARSGFGVETLRQHLRDVAGLDASVVETPFSARRRHLESLARARRYLVSAIAQLRDAGAGELVAEDLRCCQDQLGDITGRVTSDQLLGEIFSSFCIGK